MHLEAHYQKLFEESIQNIANDRYETDDLIDSSHDQRFGITLLVRPSKEVKQTIQNVLQEFKQMAPEQYYYPSSDIHITTMSIISCYEGFDLNHIDVSKYIALIQSCLSTAKKRKIHYKGLTASNSCIMLRGYMEDDFLNEIRDQLRETFKHSTLEQSLDKRYAIQTAHSTIIRFRKTLEQKHKFLKLIDKYAAYDFGAFEVQALELVYNDWYQREKYVKTLHTFEL